MSEALQALTNETTRKKKKVKKMTLCSKDKANEALVLETILCEKPVVLRSIAAPTNDAER